MLPSTEPDDRIDIASPERFPFTLPSTSISLWLEISPSTDISELINVFDTVKTFLFSQDVCHK